MVCIVAEQNRLVGRQILPSLRHAGYQGEAIAQLRRFVEGGRIGGAAKSLYYRRPVVGLAAVAPMVFCEAFVPSAS